MNSVNTIVKLVPITNLFKINIPINVKFFNYTQRKKNYKIKGYKRQLLIGNKTNKKANDEA